MNKTTLFICLVSIAMTAQQNNPKDAFLEKWQNSKTYLIGIAEAMPEEHYSFKPAERQMTFGDQLPHMRGNMLWLGNTYFTDNDFDRKSLTVNIPQGKEAIISALTESFDAV